MSEPMLYKSTREPDPKLEGMYVPKNIVGVREVAAWVRTREGWGVPFLNADGLLLRYPREDNGPLFHAWVPSGEHLLWTGSEYAEMWNYVQDSEDGESDD